MIPYTQNLNAILFSNKWIEQGLLVNLATQVATADGTVVIVSLCRTKSTTNPTLFTLDSTLSQKMNLEFLNSKLILTKYCSL